MSFKAKLSVIVITAVVVPLISILLVTHLLSGQADAGHEQLRECTVVHLLINVAEFG